LGICHRPRYASDATCVLDGMEPVALEGCEAAGRGFDLEAAEHGEATAHHLGGDGDGAPSDQVCTAARETKGN
jgi:hypothetical protein